MINRFPVDLAVAWLGAAVLEDAELVVVAPVAIEVQGDFELDVAVGGLDRVDHPLAELAVAFGVGHSVAAWLASEPIAVATTSVVFD